MTCSPGSCGLSVMENWTFLHSNEAYPGLGAGDPGQRYGRWERLPGRVRGPEQPSEEAEGPEKREAALSSWLQRAGPRGSVCGRTEAFGLPSTCCPRLSSVAQSCLILCDPVDRSTPGLPVHHRLLEFAQTHGH